MKIKSLYAGVFAMAMLASCSDDVLVDAPQNGNSTLENDQTFYISMNIKGDTDSQSRAAGDDGTPVPGTDFENGTAASENLINNAIFVVEHEVGIVDCILIFDLIEISAGIGVSIVLCRTSGDLTADRHIHKVFLIGIGGSVSDCRLVKAVCATSREEETQGHRSN